MASGFPGALDTFATNHVDGVGEVIEAADINDLADAINKIEAETGTNPSGASATLLDRLNARQTVRKTADQNFSSTTLAAVTDLVLPVTIGADHYFKFYIVWSAATAGVTQQHGISVPALNAGGYIVYSAESWTQTAIATAGTDLVSTQIASASGTKVGGAGGTSIPAANQITVSVIEGVLSNPSASSGGIQLQASTETATASTTKKGSWGEVVIA